MKIFVLGPTQSGKTCLAVGLSATAYGKTLFRRAFEASANDAASRDHLRTLRKLLQSGKWPAGTTGTDELEFGFRWKGGTKVVFSFQDYKGERSTDPARLKALGELGGEDGVVLARRNPASSERGRIDGFRDGGVAPGFFGLCRLAARQSMARRGGGHL